MSRIESLIGAMTLTEKLGQLTMTASSYAVTGPIIVGDSTDAIKAGSIGNLLNLFGAAHVHELQRFEHRYIVDGVVLLGHVASLVTSHRRVAPWPCP